MIPTSREKARRYRTAADLAALTIANALIFQAELANVNYQVTPLRRMLRQPDLIQSLVKHWEFIGTNINYIPIFRIARDVLLELPEREEMEEVVKVLGENVLKIVQERAALRHDLMGRIYHRLLLEAKFLGTYYTAVPSATLLLKLTLDPNKWRTDWSDFEQVKQLRVADLACGTGTLLMAAQQTITDNFIRATVKKGAVVNAQDLKTLHRSLMEDVFYGYDVLSSAVQLTASTLALLAPEITFRSMKLYSVPLGEQGKETRLGSLEFLSQQSLQTQVDLMTGSAWLTRPVSGGPDDLTTAPLPDLDLCVMNPPFTRSVGGNLLFGSLPNVQRQLMQKDLKKLLNNEFWVHFKAKDYASATAGLGSVFIAVADPHLKVNGRLALVLPAALSMGVAWEKSRKLISEGYDAEFLIVSHDPRQWNFSENTDIAEILFIGKKIDRSKGQSKRTSTTTCVNLWMNFKTPVDALAFADALSKVTPAPLVGQNNSFPICSVSIGGTKRAEVISMPWEEMRRGQWFPNNFAQTDIVRAAYFLRHGKLYIPTRGIVREIATTPLSELGSFGPDVRDIFDGFERSAIETPYPAYISHDSKAVTTLAQGANSYLEPRTKPMKKRAKVRPVELLWPRAGSLMLAERLRLNSQRLVSVLLPEPVLATGWWPFRLHNPQRMHEEGLVIWLNSTFGLLSLGGCRVATQGPWGKYKKPILERMPVLDPRQIAEPQLKRLHESYEHLKSEKLEPICNLNTDDVRRAFDQAICQALDIPPIDKVRSMLAREPVFGGKPLYEQMAEEDLQPELFGQQPQDWLAF